MVGIERLISSANLLLSSSFFTQYLNHSKMIAAVVTLTLQGKI